MYNVTLENKKGKWSKQERKNYCKQQALERIGETRTNTLGSKMWIIGYNGYNDITVQFENGYICKSRYSSFENGYIRNPYDRSVYGVGYIGEGEYTAKREGKSTKEYESWFYMLMRCYSSLYQEKFPTYKGCSVCVEWHNFQNFAKWYNDNYYEVEGKRMELDKDILFKGNKVYSPSTCIFVPNNINTLFIKGDSMRGKYPIGVYFHKERKKFRAHCKGKNGEYVGLGEYETPIDAFNAYRKGKKEIIKQIAGEYKSKIPQSLYNAMLQYEVSIDD